MPITEPEWQSIAVMVEKIIKRIVGTKADYFITGKVIKVDKKNKCIFMKEFGDQPIPIIAFDYEVKYYDETPQGTVYGAGGSAAAFKTSVKKATATVILPKVGDTVLVAREMGTRRLPRALGVIQGKKWIIPEVE